jgi:hypothetical protein
MQTTKEADNGIQLRSDLGVLEALETCSHLAVTVCRDVLRGQLLRIHEVLECVVPALLEMYIIEEAPLDDLIHFTFEL